ncbi:hypothetical protein Lfu02_17510 [Longispora fulva]|uniref:Uncharacterized protein n=1 Tax=Longispora fulva TaxID=619741 RepID=A0A8J7GNA6_9ACTN|nr:hypothetical protein [Longispora fulva]MBG6140242.1 hypothetical protein [Longispora fulva]GIG57379.1 hypothetical protein Lfu02_17510 [Longispora fulva]
MASPRYSKTKGRDAENAVVDYLRAQGFANVERRRLAGANDRGDLTGLPGVVVEVKAEKSYKVKEWLREAETERANDAADLGVVWAKIPGGTDPGQWVVMMTGETFVRECLRGWFGVVDAPTGPQ